MAKEKKQNKEEKKSEKTEVLTIAAVFQKLGQKGAKDRKGLAEKIVKYLADKNITENNKSRLITIDNVTSQIGAMIKDINDKRGKERNSWWSKFIVEESNVNLKIIKTVA